MGRMGGILVGVLWRRGGVVMVGVCWERHHVLDKSIEVVLNKGLLMMFLMLNKRLLCSAAGHPLLLAGEHAGGKTYRPLQYNSIAMHVIRDARRVTGTLVCGTTTRQNEGVS